MLPVEWWMMVEVWCMMDYYGVVCQLIHQHSALGYDFAWYRTGMYNGLCVMVEGRMD